MAIYTPFTDRLAKDRLLIIICLLSATAVLIGLSLVISGQQRLGYFLLYPLSTVIPAIFNLQWWTYVASLYLFMATLISNVGGSNAVPILADLARQSDAHLRAATLDILAATDTRGTAVFRLKPSNSVLSTPEIPKSHKFLIFIIAYDE